MAADLTDIKPFHRGADFYQELVRRYRENGGHWCQLERAGFGQLIAEVKDELGAAKE
jgi:hypothetical protein